MKFINIKAVVVVMTTMCISQLAHAGAIITSDLTIEAESSLSGLSQTLDGGVASSTHHVVSGGVVTTGEPATGLLTNIDDGIFVSSDISGDTDFNFVEQFFELLITLTNTSAFDYTVFFNLDFDVSVQTTLDNGSADGYAGAEMWLDDNDGNELFGVHRVTDNFFGNQVDAVDNGDFGGSESAANTNFGFSLFVGAGQSASIIGEWDIWGENLFESPFVGHMDGLLTIVDVQSEQRQPDPVPEPATYLLTLMGLLIMVGRSLKLKAKE